MTWWTSLLHPRRIVDQEGREIARALRREDALLCAAAPEMRDALKLAQDRLHISDPEVSQSIKTALAKTIGEDE
jgi:hypothetical protein